MGNMTILDGGMGVELIRRGIVPRGGLWSAQALIDHPEGVAAVHQDYVDAGATVITTNSYSTVPEYMAKQGLQDSYVQYTKKAGQIARDVGDAAGNTLVAGSLPPLSESYRADLVPSDEAAAPIYDAMVAALDPYVDLFLCETMSTSQEAYNALSAVRRAGNT